MREILFRGKRIDNGEWVYGYLYITHNGEYEISHYDNDVNIERMTSTVIPETVGQYTGLKDDNGDGTKIFEGDCIVGKYYFDRQKETGKKPSYGIVESEVWNCGCCHSVYGFSTGGCEPDLCEDVIIIGNIYDNPELLKGE